MQKIKSFHRIFIAVFFFLSFIPSSFGATVDVMAVFDTTAKTWVDSNGGMNTFTADAGRSSYLPKQGTW